MIRGLPLVFALLLCASSVQAAPQNMSRQQIADIAKTVPGFSYWWGGGAWLPGSGEKGKCIPKGGSGCPNCSHTGKYGADCSGFVAKAWQIDKPTPLQQNYHPYSTWHFHNQSVWWWKLPKGEAKLGDAFNYNKNGAGHVFLYEKGNPWGSVYAWECKGCSYGCVYNLRSVSADYALIRRKQIVEPPACKKHCEGTVIVGDDCGKGDCAAYGATCVSDDLGVRCVSVFCPAKGTTTTCLPDPKNGKIATCVNGNLKDPGDCGAYGAICSTAVPPQPTCVSTFCASSPKASPQAGELCYMGKRYTCDTKGKLTETPCPAGQPCQTLPGQTGPGSALCGPKPCGNCDDGNPCTDDGCSDGTCTHKPNAKGCDDGNPCTSGDVCGGGNCAGSKVVCDDGLACTDDSCQGGACVHAPQNGACDDGVTCTEDVCGSAGCSHTPQDVACDDGNPCTSDTCAGSGPDGCSHMPQDGPCEDGDGCTVGGACKDGSCQPGTAKVCDDWESCTSDACVDGNCVHAPVAGPCDDGDACTTSDYCAMGLCLAGESLTCDDGLPCTADSCLDGACVHSGGREPDTSCKDGQLVTQSPCPGMDPVVEPCPEGEVCQDGACVPTSDASSESDGGAASSDGSARAGSPDTGTTSGGQDGSTRLGGAEVAKSSGVNSIADKGSPSPGCSAGPTSGGSVPWLLLGMAGLWGWRRRSRAS